jgi:hypothetical protein
VANTTFNCTCDRSNTVKKHKENKRKEKERKINRKGTERRGEP